MPSTTSDLPSPGLEWQRFVPVPLRTVAEGSGMGCMCLPQPQGQSMAMGRLPSCLAMPVSAAQCSRALLASTAEVCGTPPPLARSDMPNRLFLLLGLLPVLLSSAVWVARPLLFIRLARTPGEHSQRSPDLSVWSLRTALDINRVLRQTALRSDEHLPCPPSHRAPAPKVLTAGAL